MYKAFDSQIRCTHYFAQSITYYLILTDALSTADFRIKRIKSLYILLESEFSEFLNFQNEKISEFSL
ncbi:MAG: hypothetical protein KAI83_07065, partial [Thiomargarita sp.]|nr:hypothetical protein [Thiomargarita sp.]